MVRAATDADYNKPGGEVRMKLEIYFDGVTRPPLVVSGENFLIDAEILEEAGADSNWPLGDVSANELTFSLYNDNGIFNPMNKQGIYYGKIKTGVVVKPFIRPGSIEDAIQWDQMGEFKVTNWQATITGMEAAVVAQDAVKEINAAEKMKLPVVRDGSYKDHYENVFNYFGLPHNVDEYYATKILPFAFMSPTNSETLRYSTIASRSICMSDRLGIMRAKPIRANAPIRAILTDGDQIVNANSDQSILSDYRGVALYYSSPQVTSNTLLLGMSALKVKPGLQVHEQTTFAKSAMLLITNIIVKADQKVRVVDFKATSDDIVITTVSDHTTDTEVSLEIYGVALDHIEQAIKDVDVDGEILEIRNNYIQTSDEAKSFKTALQSYVDGNVPELFLDIKGNPLIQVGDKVRAISERHRLDFTGIVKRTTVRYNGGISGQMVLINASMFGGV